MSDKTSSQLLDASADQIDRVGWARDDWYVLPPGFGGIGWTECRVCAGGGINVADGFPPDFDDHEGLDDGHPVAQAFMALARQITGRDVTDVDDAVQRVIEWNDAEGRTAEEVVRELRAAAASEREAGR